MRTTFNPQDLKAALWLHEKHGMRLSPENLVNLMANYEDLALVAKGEAALLIRGKIEPGDFDPNQFIQYLQRKGKH